MRANYREEYEGMEFYARMDPCLANQMYTNKTDTPCFLEFGEKACSAYSVRVMLLPDSMQWAGVYQGLGGKQAPRMQVNRRI
jgi:hypothetical protein